ncbi:AAA family ATPase [Natronoarchaeum rubrum]|uniref:AAA family ATPase n=1 Tax=Natronoarchaeum rubrum TaxID=755311 RepID=UPI0021122B97|nr:AAA family ATPase [Natronoarchaeum rubrum]
MGRIKEIAEATDAELDEYLAEQGWADNPFAGEAGLDEYVLPSEEDIADIAAAIRSYTGPVLVHSHYSGVGKTTLLRVLLAEYADEYQTVHVGEHNVTPYELASIVADEIGVGKSSSTKLTEQKIRDADLEEPVLLGIDEFGLNDPDTLHVIQFLNDLEDVKVILTGMTSQWEAIGQLGSEGRAFQRRVSYQLQLSPLDRHQTAELVQRRQATALGLDHDEYAGVDVAPFTEAALDEIYERAQGVPAVITAACAELVGLAAYRYANGLGAEIDTDLVDAVEFADPLVEGKEIAE